MNADWPSMKISDVAVYRNNKRIPLKSLDRAKRQGIYPYYGASGVVDYIDDYIFNGTYLLISEDGENLRSRKTPVAFKAHGKFWVNNHAHILEEKEEGILDYLEYYFSQLDLTPYITGAVQPKLNKNNLDTIEIPIPPLEERRAINGILNSLTYKIDLNHQTNQTLEQIAQAIFKSWFVDFEPVKAKVAVLEAGGSEEDAQLAAMQAISGKSLDELIRFESEHPEQYAELCATAELFPAAMQDSELGEIPEGWMVNQLAQLGDVVCGKTPAKSNPDYFGIGVPFIKIPDMHSSVYVTQPIEQLTVLGAASQPKKMIPPGSVCVSCIATVGKVVLTHEVSQTNQQINSIIPNQPEYSFYLYFQMLEKQQEFLDLASGGSATLNMNTSTFSRVEVLLPSAEIIKLFQRTVMPIFHEILANQKQSDSLTSLRDTILPKLLSGQILLKSAEAM